LERASSSKGEEERVEMTTEEIAELFLAHLYELAEEAPHPNFLFSVNDFIPRLGMIDREEVQKAINYLGDRGFVILASFDMLGGISAGITIEGSAFVEKGGETGMIGQYRKNPRTLAKTLLVGSSLPIDQERTGTVNEEGNLIFARRAVEAILEDIKDMLDRDDTVTADAKKDLLSDLATIKIQMERNVRSRQIIDVVLGNLSGISSIVPLVTGLKHIIETYFR
jgi:hypothetical protein